MAFHELLIIINLIFNSMFTTLSVLGVFILTEICKKYIKPKFGDTGIHIFAFLVALVIVLVKGFATTYPTFGAMLITAGQYLIGSLALYKIIVKPLTEQLNNPLS